MSRTWTTKQKKKSSSFLHRIDVIGVINCFKTWLFMTNLEILEGGTPLASTEIDNSIGKVLPRGNLWSIMRSRELLRHRCAVQDEDEEGEAPPDPCQEPRWQSLWDKYDDISFSISNSISSLCIHSRISPLLTLGAFCHFLNTQDSELKNTKLEWYNPISLKVVDFISQGIFWNIFS